MSQYLAPAPGTSIESMMREVHQQLWTLTQRLYGNGQPGEIDLLHTRISTLGHEFDEFRSVHIAKLQSWQDERSGAGSLVRIWVIPLIAVAISLAVAWASIRRS
jgi:hypothetical protein